MFVFVALSVGTIVGGALDESTLAAGEGQAVVLADIGGGEAAAGRASTDAGGGSLAPPAGDVPAPRSASPQDAPAPPPSPTPDPEPVPEEPDPEEPARNKPQKEEPRPEETTDVAGTVVHANPEAGSYVLASPKGDLIAVHARPLPKLGANLTAKVTDLANGTKRELEETIQGSDAGAKLRGTVTFVVPEERAYVVSARGASILVRAAEGDGTLPALRDLVTVQVRFEDAGVGANPRFRLGRKQ